MMSFEDRLRKQERAAEAVDRLGEGDPAAARKILQSVIEETDDFDELTGKIAGRIMESDLPRPAQTKLLKLIAKKAGVSVSDLRGEVAETSKAGENPTAAIKELNARHAVVPLGGKTYIMNQEYDPALDRALLTFSSKQDFLLRYCNRKTVCAGEEIDIGEFWLGAGSRRQYNGITFSPGKEVDGYFNLFQGFGVEPEPGTFGRFHDFVFDVICAGNDELFEYVWCWLAHLFQKPRELPGTALVLRGLQGTGKNTFADTIGRLLGKHYIAVSKLDQVTGRFSGHLADALLVFANEAIWGGDKSAEGTLKSIITDPTCAIEQKHRDIITVRNFKRLIVASNEDWVVPRGLDDRRFIVLDVPDIHKEDLDYFGAIKEELKAGGYSALLDALLKVDLAGWYPMRRPTAAVKSGWDIKIRSAGSVVQWWFSCLDRGYVADDDAHYRQGPPEWPTIEIPKETVYTGYLSWCRARNVTHPVLDNTFAKALRDFHVTPCKPRPSRTPSFKFPNLDQSRQVFSDVVGVPNEYWEEGGPG